MKKLLSVLLSALIVISAVSCLFTLSASAEEPEVLFTYGCEDAAVGNVPFKEAAPASGEPDYPSGDKWGVVAAAGYGVWNSTLTTMNVAVFDGNVYGADGTLIGVQTAQKRPDSTTVWNGNLTVVESAGNGHNGSNKYIKVKRVDIAYALGMAVEANTNYELTYWVKTSGQSDGARSYFGSGVFSSINIATKNSSYTGSSTIEGQIPNMLFDKASQWSNANKCVFGEMKGIAKAESSSYTDWTKITHQFTTPAENVNKVYFVVSNGIDSQGVFLDDISLTKLPVTVDPNAVKVEFYDAKSQKLSNDNSFGKVTVTPTGNTFSMTVDYSFTPAYSFLGWYKDNQFVSSDIVLTDIPAADVGKYVARIKNLNLYKGSSWEGYEAGTSVKHTDTGTQFPTNAQWGGIRTTGYRSQTVPGTVYDITGKSYNQVQSGGYSHSGTFTVTDSAAHSGDKSLNIRELNWSFATALENIKPGKTYTLSFMVKGNHSSEESRNRLKNAAVVTTVNFGNDEGKLGFTSGHLANNLDKFALVRKSNIAVSSDDWTQISLDFSVPQNLISINTLYFFLDASNSGSNYIYDMFIDDISLTEVFDGVETAYNDVAAIRTAEFSSTGKNGLRIYNEIKNDFVTENNIVEYGSVVAKTEKLGAAELTLDNALAKGMAYNKETLTTPKLWKTKENSKIYTAYLTGILSDYYTSPYTIRAYAIDDLGTEYYGEKIALSVYDVVNAIDNGQGVAAQTAEDKAAFMFFAGGDDFVKYDNWVKERALFSGKLRNEAKAADTLSGEALTEALEITGYYEPLFERAIANEGNLALLKKVFEKANRQEDITVVGFGGSITQGAACTDVKDSYSYLVKEALQAKFPKITVNYFNAGIGSTSSVFGIARMTNQVLSHNPDLVLLDFTTNDQPDAYHAGSYEAILRTLLQKEIAVVTITYGNIVNSEYNDGNGVYHRGTNREELHGPVMLYNDVPVIDYYGVMWDCYLDSDGDGYNVDTDAARWKNLWADYIHPTVAGHKLSANAIIYYLDKVYSKLSTITDTKFIPETPLDKHTENFMGAEMFDYDTKNTASVTVAKSADVTKGSYGNVDSTTIFHYNTWDITAGEYVEFTVSKAKFFGLLRVKNRTAGTANIYINGQLAMNDNAYMDHNGLNWLDLIKFYDGSDTVKVRIEGVNGTYRVTKALLACGE